jgi:hypothetical protein
MRLHPGSVIVAATAQASMASHLNRLADVVGMQGEPFTLATHFRDVSSQILISDQRRPFQHDAVDRRAAEPVRRLSRINFLTVSMWCSLHVGGAWAGPKNSGASRCS